MPKRISRAKPAESRRAWLVGATGGLGPALAHRLARDGYDLLLTARRRRRECAALGRELRAAYPERAVEVRCGDIGDPKFAAQAAAVAARRGALDAVVLASGDLFLGRPSRTPAKALRAQLESNLLAPWTAALAALPALRRSRLGGRIVFFGMAGAGLPTAKRAVSAHAAAKLALLSMARSLALEVARDGVVVWTVSPGVVRTARSTPDAVEPFLEHVPGGRALTPDEVADAVAWCLSPGGACGTGGELPVALGFGL